MKNRQSGLSLVGVLLSGVVLVFFFLVGMRTVPVFTEYMALKRIINAIVETRVGADVTIQDVRRDFDKRADVQDVTSVSGQDLIVVKRGNSVEISVEYTRTVPLVANASLLFEFQTTAKNSGS